MFKRLQDWWRRRFAPRVLTPAERARFEGAGAELCSECDHPTGHHYSDRRGCAWGECECGEVPEFPEDHPDRIKYTKDPRVLERQDGYWIQPEVLVAWGFSRNLTEAVLRRCHDAAGVPNSPERALKLAENQGSSTRTLDLAENHGSSARTLDLAENQEPYLLVEILK